MVQKMKDTQESEEAQSKKGVFDLLGDDATRVAGLISHCRSVLAAMSRRVASFEDKGG